jgi:hypothetical protein
MGGARKVLKQRTLVQIVISIIALAAAMASPIMAPAMAADSYPLETTDPEVADALDYLRGEQATDGSIGSFVDSAWVAMAIAASDEDPHDWQEGGNSIVDYLAANAGSAGSSTDYSRMILAIVASGEDPTNFGGRDFVSLLEGTYDDTSQQIGDESSLNDDAFGIMALVAAGQSQGSQIITDAVSFLIDNQNGDGGWGYSVGSDSDVNMSSAVIMALISGGELASSGPLVGALAYIKSTQQAGGGFLYWGSTDAETDSWAINAIVACGEDPNGAGWRSTVGNTPVDDLLTYQQAGGEFYFQDGLPGAWPSQTTAKAIIALLGEFYPVVALEPTGEEGYCVDVRIEGQSSTIWSGSVTVTESVITATDSGIPYYYEDPTALGALDEASEAGSFDYETTDAWGSPFITSIGGEAGSASSAWLYRVDYVSAQVGAGDFILGETAPPNPPHREVLFYYVWDNNWGALPLRIEVDNAEPEVGEQFTVTVSEYSDDSGAWSPCEGATVHADSNYLTGASGTADITIDMDATLEIYAEKDSFIRSNRVTVTVGTGSGTTGEVDLTATIFPAIAITVEPGSLDFGELGPRDTSDPQPLTITNVGAWDVEVTGEVAGEAGDLYFEGLKLNGDLWELFAEIINRGDDVEYSVTLTVPEDYTGVGEQGGTVIFWAAEAP